MLEIMQAGASAVKISTLFVPTYECDADPAFKQSYINCKKEDIVIIDSPVGLPGRVIRSDFVDQIMAGKTKPFKCPWHCLTTCNFTDAPFCIAQALFNAAQGKMDEGFVFAGAKAYMASSMRHVSEVMDSLIAEYAFELQKTQVFPLNLKITKPFSGNTAFSIAV
jgi:NAD(P)H-dependent flavin oxidoreductase YrpB (nitropropane dioxygenase family)